MIDTSGRKRVRESDPDLVFRIPGPWRTHEQLREALPYGHAIDDDRIILPDGSAVQLCAWPRDHEFPEIFETSTRGRLSTRSRRLVHGYAMNAGVTGPGGSLGSARRILRAAAAIIRAGGLGVLIDNSLLAHDGADVLEMADSDDPEALIVAYVNSVGRTGELWSLGMHALGLHDAVISRTGDDMEDQGTLFQLLCVICETEDAIEAGDFVHTEDRVLRVSHETAGRFHAASPAHNPYGQWHLERTNGLARTPEGQAPESHTPESHTPESHTPENRRPESL